MPGSAQADRRGPAFHRQAREGGSASQAGGFIHPRERTAGIEPPQNGGLFWIGFDFRMLDMLDRILGSVPATVIAAISAIVRL